jgi:hypothetical protein
MTVPDFLPILSAGAHEDPSEGACLMEYVSLLAGEEFGDSPSCTHPVLARAARTVNDALPDADRHLLVPLIGRLFGTADMRPQLDRRILCVRLAVWSARRVEHLLRAGDRAACVAATDAAEMWANEPTKKNANAAANAAYAYAAANAAYADAAYAYAYAAAYAAYAYAAANAAYADAAYAYAYAAANAAYAYAAANAAAYAAYAYAAANADTADSLALVGFLSDLLDYHARLTGHVARDVTDSEMQALSTTVGA